MRPDKILTGSLVASFCIVALGRVEAAVTLWIHDDSNRLATVDLGTGAVNIIGSFGLNAAIEPMTDIAFDPSGNLYGVSFRLNGTGSTLYRISAATAAITPVGPLGLIDQNALVFGADGTLYSAGALKPDLYTLNTSTGAATLLGNWGISPSAGDLAFKGGSLYVSSASHDLIRITLSGGVSGTVAGPFGFSSVFGLATGDDGVLYGVAGTKVFQTNTTTGAGTLVLDYAGSGLGPALGSAFFAESGAAAVPEPNSLSLLALGYLGLLAFARHLRPRSRLSPGHRP